MPFFTPGYPRLTEPGFEPSLFQRQMLVPISFKNNTLRKIPSRRASVGKQLIRRIALLTPPGSALAKTHCVFLPSRPQIGPERLFWQSDLSL